MSVCPIDGCGSKLNWIQTDGKPLFTECKCGAKIEGTEGGIFVLISIPKGRKLQEQTRGRSNPYWYASTSEKKRASQPQKCLVDNETSLIA